MINKLKIGKWLIDNRSIIVGVSMCCMLCCICLLFSSRLFLNALVTAKWMGPGLCLGIAGIAWGMLCKKIHFPARAVFLILTSCFLLVFVRDWAALGFDMALLTYLIGLLALFFIVRQIVALCPPKCLFGAVIVFALATSLFGILQYAEFIPSRNPNFAVTGNFDNPAGFAASLACALPFCFLFFANGKKHLPTLPIFTVRSGKIRPSPQSMLAQE